MLFCLFGLDYQYKYTVPKWTCLCCTLFTFGIHVVKIWCTVFLGKFLNCLRNLSGIRDPVVNYGICEDLPLDLGSAIPLDNPAWCYYSHLIKPGVIPGSVSLPVVLNFCCMSFFLLYAHQVGLLCEECMQSLWAVPHSSTFSVTIIQCLRSHATFRNIS
jgi:hypothetical protein